MEPTWKPGIGFVRIAPAMGRPSAHLFVFQVFSWGWTLKEKEGYVSGSSIVYLMFPMGRSRMLFHFRRTACCPQKDLNGNQGFRQFCGKTVLFQRTSCTAVDLQFVVKGTGAFAGCPNCPNMPGQFWAQSAMCCLPLFCMLLPVCTT